jgi:two-component system nitrogen regulation response regulator NtrX
VIPIEIPALRDRVEDIPILVDTFLEKCAVQYQSIRKAIDPKALELLMNYNWPGNVRELKNLVERLAIMVGGEKIQPHHIPAPYNTASGKGAELMDAKLFSINNLNKAKKAFEVEFIRKKLQENDNDVKKTAKRMGVDKTQLDKKIKNLES